AGLTPRKVPSTALASFPGITRGITKFTVSAAHRVTTNRPARRARYGISATAEAQSSLPTSAVRAHVGRPTLDTGAPGPPRGPGTDTAKAVRTHWIRSASR